MSHLDKARWKVVGPLLDQLLDTDIAGRAARLAEVRRDDRRLAVELEALLAHQTAANRAAFLDSSVMPGDAGAEGATLGRYTLDALIGRGGMASVWLAHRSDGFYDGQVAIKLLDPVLLQRSGAERFRREASLLARLSHPNIVRLMDAGVATNGQPYLVLEHVAGVPIDRWCDDHSLSTAARLRLFVDVLAAVAHAHDRRVLHRDLKPANILVTEDGQVKLLDFGIARLLGPSDSAAAGDEGAASEAFTPRFAAPEQVQRGLLSTATDVYSLGVLLYVLVSGEHPTAVPNATATATATEWLQAIIDMTPRPLSTLEKRPVPPAMRDGLDALLAKALKKNPAERYATPAAMAADLRGCLDLAQADAPRDQPREASGAAAVVPRRTAVVIAMRTALLALALVAGGSVHTASPPAEPPICLAP